jgi:hypothetical protein
MHYLQPRIVHKFRKLYSPASGKSINAICMRLGVSMTYLRSFFLHTNLQCQPCDMVRSVSFLATFYSPISSLGPILGIIPPSQSILSTAQLEQFPAFLLLPFWNLVIADQCVEEL